VAKKIHHYDEVLGGISRLSFQMTVATVPQQKMLHAIELLGTKAAPLARSALATRLRPPRGGGQAVADVSPAVLK
jgi:hypothetical protein